MKGWLRRLVETRPGAVDVTLLLLRLGGGALMALQHGWPKLSHFNDKADSFPDPLGLGNPTVSLVFAVAAEFFCSILVVLGLGTRLAAFALVFTMGVAAFVVHADDPFAKKEMALLYLTIFLPLVVAGAGRWSVDGTLTKGR